MSTRRGLAGLAAASLCLAAGAAAQPAGDAAGSGVAALVQVAESVCADSPPPSEDCWIAQRELAAGVRSALFRVGDSGERAAAVELVRAFADWPFADVRYAAAAALGGLFPDGEDTPILARLLNDPVPAVRGAALAALRQSSDPAARQLVGRAADPQGDAMQPDGPLVDPAALPVPLPDGAEPVRFTDDADYGIAAFVTDRTPEEVVAWFAAAAGGTAIGIDALGALFGVDAPPVDTDDPMAMVRFMQELQERIGRLPEEEQQPAYLAALQAFAASNAAAAEHPLARWRDSGLYADPMAVVLPDDPAAPSSTPNRIAIVYRDLVLGRTGFALQWVEPAEMPPQPSSTIEAAAAEDTAAGGLFGQSAPVERDHLSGDEVEALLWEAVQANADPVAAEAFADIFADGPHADSAERLQAELEQLPLEPIGEEAEPEREQSLSGVEPVDPAPTLTAGDPIFASNERIVVGFRGLPANPSRRQWIAIAPAGAPDTAWGDWAYVDGSAGELGLPHQPAGDYELRLYLEAPRAVVARLPVTVEPAADASVPTLAADKEAFAVGETIGVRWAGMPGNRSDWITVVAAGTPDTSWGDWAYTDRGATGRLELHGLTEPGDYEIRAYLESPREVVARLPIRIAAAE